MNGNGPLSFEATINDSNYQSRLNAMERRVMGFTNTAVQQANRFEQSFQNLGRLAVGAFAFTKLAELPQELLRVRGEFQQLEIAFTTMLRSKSKADAFLKEGAAFAATTPFNLRDVGTAQKQLLAYGFSVNEIIPSLKRLGDISAGLGLPLERLTYLYGTTKTQGRLFAQDLNQFVGSGIPLIAELAKQFGVAEDKVRGLVEDGKVGFKEVKKAIEGMTSGSGIFTGTLDAQSKSLLGLKERLGDAYAAMLNDIGKQNEGIAADLLTTATDVVQHYQDVIDIIEVLVASYGGYKAALLLANVAQIAQLPITEAQAIAQAQAANATGFLTLSQTRAAASTALLTRAQAALNGVLSVNPILLIGTALAALTTAYFVFRDEVAKIKSAQELMAESGQQVADKMATQKAAVTGLIGTIKNQNVAESERKKAYDQLNQVAPDILKNLDFEKAKTADLTKELDKYLVSLRQKIRLEAGQDDLKAAYKQEFDAAKARQDAQENLNNLIAESDKLSKRRSAGSESTGNSASIAAAQQIAAAKQVVEARAADEKKAADERTKVEQAYGRIVVGNNLEALKAERARAQVVLDTASKTGLAYKQAEDEAARLDKQIAELSKTKEDGVKAENLTVKAIQDKIKAKREDLSLTNNTAAQNAKIRAEIEELQAQERELTGKRTKAEKDADKVGPLGSLSYYDNVIKKTDEALSKVSKDDSKNIARLLAVKTDAEQKAAEIRTLLETPAGSVKYFESIAAAASEALSKTPVTNTAVVEKQKQIIIDAQAQAEEARKLIVVRSFDEELAYKRSQYEVYQKWVEAYGKQSADTQFGILLKSGESYIDLLNRQIAQLEADKENFGLTDRQAGNLSTLIDERNNVTGKKSSLDVFNEGLQQAQAEAQSLSAYLVALKQRQDDLNGSTPQTGDDFAKRNRLAEEITQTQLRLKQQLNQYLVDFSGSEQQQVSIRTKYNELRAELDKKYLINRGSEYQQALSVINSDEEKALEDFQQRQLEQTESYKATTKVILQQGEKRAEIEIKQQRRVVEDAKKIGGVTSEVYKQALSKLNSLIEQNGGGPAQKMLGQYAAIFGQMGQSLSQLDGNAGKAGQALVALSSNLDLISQAFAVGKSKSDLYGIAIQGVVGLFQTITTAAAQRKKAEVDYYTAINAQQQQYNLLLNEQLGIQAKSRENVFVKDYTGELKDAFAQYDDAQVKYQASLNKLNEGRAKAGLQNYFDASSFLSTVGSAAATGAAIGSIIPGIGTAVGAVVGGIVGSITGFFSSNKKVDEFSSLLGLYPGLIQKTTDGVDKLNTSLAESLIQQGLVDDKTKDLLQSTLDWQKQIDAAKEAIKGIISELAGNLGNSLRDNLVNAFRDGTDAALAFKTAVGGILEDLVTKMLFSKAFNSLFDQLEKDLSKSLDVTGGGDGNTIDDFERFTKNSEGALAQYNLWLQQFQDAAAASGFDVLKPTSTSSTKNPNSISGVIQAQVTEATANVLEGQINAIRITTTDTNALIRQNLIFLSGIEKNTGRTADNTDRLESIDRSLKTLAANTTRGLGQPG